MIEISELPYKITKDMPVQVFESETGQYVLGTAGQLKENDLFRFEENTLETYIVTEAAWGRGVFYEVYSE